MSVKERLRDYRVLVRYIKRLDDDIEQLRDRATGLKAQHDALGTRIQGDAQADIIGDIVAALADTARLQKKKLREAQEERKELEALVSRLSYQGKLLIEMRYFDGCTWDEVAATMQYSRPRVHQIHGDILSELER